MHKPNNRLMTMPKIMGVEMKPTPLVIDLEELKEAEIGKVSSPNSTISTASGKRFDGFGGEKDGNSDEDDGGNSGGITGDGDRRIRGERKKLRLTKEQIIVLEKAFREHTTLNTVSSFISSLLFLFFPSLGFFF